MGIMFSLIYQYDPVVGTQAYSENSMKMISSDKMSGMQGMSNNMSGMQGMSRMRGISGMYGITSNDEISVFLECMLVIISGLVGVPFAWVILRERRRKSNRTNRPAN